jgi:DNA polymerase-4
MIGHSRVLDPDLRSPDKSRLMLRRLLVKACKRLRDKTHYAQSIHMSMRTTNGYKWTDHRDVQAAQDPFTFLQQLDDMWENMMQHLPRVTFIKPMDLAFKKVSVILSDLTPSHAITEDIFVANIDRNLLAQQKKESLTKAMDHLQNKYCKELVTIGQPPKTLAGYVGTKIAFARVPDQSEFWG